MSNLKSLPLKKEFVTYWQPEDIIASSSASGAYAISTFFNRGHGMKSEALVPTGISYKDLYSFSGRKTKVTIEILE